MGQLSEKEGKKLWDSVNKPTKVPIWQKTKFWSRVEKSFLYIGSTITAIMVLAEVDKIWTFVVIVCTILGGLTGFWFSDENRDGIPDIFQ